MTGFSPDRPGFHDSQMWGDLQSANVTVAGGKFQTPELFRVTSPFPTVWRVIAALRVNAAANLGVSMNLVLLVGLGRSTISMRIDAAPNITLNFEVPGQSFSAHFETDAPAADDIWQFGASIAPLFPWTGVEVIPVDHPPQGDSWEQVVEREQARLQRRYTR